MTAPSESTNMSDTAQLGHEQVTNADLGQLVRWMLDSGMYDTDDIVDALTKTEKYADELYAATHDIDQATFDECAEIRQKAEAGGGGQVPDGWTVTAVSSIDTQMRCDHGQVVLDTRSDCPVQVTPCQSGCAATAQFLFRSEPGDRENVVPLRGRKHLIV